MVNEWARDDIPVAAEAVTAYLRGRDASTTTSDALSLPGVHAILDAVVDRLNEHHPKPPFAEEGIRLIHERDRWRRAHSIVEQERDQAREQRDAWKREHDRLVVHGSVRGDTYAAMVRKRDEAVARAEAAEARTTPAVTREDVEKAVKGTLEGSNITLPEDLFDAQIDAVWSLVSGADPAVHVVRESQIAAVKVTEAGQFWRAGETGIPLPWKANKVREKRDECATEWVELEAIARAIDAAGLLAPAPMREEWRAHDQRAGGEARTREQAEAALLADELNMDDEDDGHEPGWVTQHRYVTEWDAS